MDIYAKVDEAYNLAFKIRYSLRSPSNHKSILARNTSLRNLHNGERCFILGNGPSLQNEALELLKDEVVFSVNQAYRNTRIRDINPLYHFWIDNNFFEINGNNPEDTELLECMKLTANGTDLISCFYPINRYDFVLNYDLLIDNRTFFISPILHFVKPQKFDPNISQLTYSYGTVVQNAINTAVYMGFKEIYLLGCDSTGIINTLNSALKVDNDDYSYKVTDNEKLRMEKMVDRANIADYAYSYYMTLKGFDFLYKACNNLGVKLVNCSNTSVLDMIPRMTLKQVLNK